VTRSTRRLDIQALRGVAVLAVLLYHVWPHRLSGGYVGVDVFFVISGFLITGLLLRELEATGTVRLGAFWARRARRLLPSALLVAGMALVGTLLVAPASLQLQFAKEIAASVLYVENWALAQDGADYLAADNPPSPVQHYWSLSVEEQFYLVWPLLLLLAGSAAVRRLGGPRRVAAVLMTAIAGASFAGSVALVAQGSPLAYFGTHVRAWEFAAGALVAIALAGRTLPGRAAWSPALAWVGLAMIALAAVSYDASTPFPGVAALLPVAGSMLVLAAHAEGSWSLGSVGRRTGLVWLGEISYAAYLWHWPLIVLLGYAAPRALEGLNSLLVVAATLGLAWASTRFLEDPIRRLPLSTRPQIGRMLVASLVAMAVVAAPALGVWRTEVAVAQAEIAEAEARVALQEACFGAGAALDPDGCAPLLTGVLTPSPSAARDDLNDAYIGDCFTYSTDTDLRSCEWGDPSSDFRVALVGDSHVGNWVPAFQQLAEDRGWSLTTHMKSACPESAAFKRGSSPEAESSCIEWNRQMATGQHIDEPYDLVVVSHSTRGATYASSEIAIEGFLAAWQKYLDGGSTIVVMADNPFNTREVLECLVANADDPLACSVPIDEAFPGPDNMVAAAERIPGRAVVIETSDIFCSDGFCHAVIGDAVVYRDVEHLTATFAATLTPIIGQRLDAALAELATR
jgi:peptidoglycan/LPS O-acetylase OafA/YrhL